MFRTTERMYSVSRLIAVPQSFVMPVWLSQFRPMNTSRFHIHNLTLQNSDSVNTPRRRHFQVTGAAEYFLRTAQMFIAVCVIPGWYQVVCGTVVCGVSFICDWNWLQLQERRSCGERIRQRA